MSKAKGMSVGDRAFIDGKKGTIKFVGKTDFMSGLCIGVAYDKPHGENDGSFQGKRYFTCPENHGVFVFPARIALVIKKKQKNVSDSPKSPKRSKKKNTRTGSLRGSPKTSPISESKRLSKKKRGSGIVSPGFSSNSPKNSPKNSSRTLGKNSPRNSPKNSSRTLNKKSPKKASSRKNKSSPKKVLPDLKEGNVVLWSGKKTTIRFVGTTKFASGKWVGLELDHSETGGKNNGEVQGVRYFSCPPGKGLFVKPATIEALPDENSVPNDSGPRESEAEPVRPEKGDIVTVPKGHEGVVRFLGITKFAKGLWAGIELKTPSGKNDGSVQGVKYFECPSQHGLFIKPSKLTVVKSMAAERKKEQEKKEQEEREREQKEQEESEREQKEQEEREREQKEQEKKEREQEERERKQKEKEEREQKQKEKIKKEKREANEKAAIVSKTQASSPPPSRRPPPRPMAPKREAPKKPEKIKSQTNSKSPSATVPTTKTPTTRSPSTRSPVAKKSRFKEALLEWCRTTTEGYGVTIVDFTKSWRNGLAFAAICSAYRPDAFDFDALSPSNREKNIKTAFKVAEDIGILVLLDIEDVFYADQQTIMLQVNEFRKVLLREKPKGLRAF